MTVSLPHDHPHPLPGWDTPSVTPYPPNDEYHVSNGGSQRKLWVTAAALLGVAIVCGAVVFWDMFKMLDAQPHQSNQFDNGESISVMLADGETKYLYGEAGSPQHRMSCGSASTEMSWDALKADVTINRWKALVAATADRPGFYEITCEGREGDRFGVGEKVSAPPRWAMELGVLATLGSVAAFLVGATKPRRR